MDGDLKEDLKINRFKLHEECEKQPSLYLYYGELLSEAKKNKDAYDELLGLALGEVELNIRRMDSDELNENYGISKVTDKAILSILSIHPKIKKYKAKVLEAKAEVYKYDTLVKVLEHRKSELNNLVSLYIAGYFSLPKGKNTVNDQVGNEIRKNMNRKRKES